MPDIVKRALGTAMAQRFLKTQIDRRLPPGPTPAQQARGRAVVVATARSTTDDTVTSRLTTPEPYLLTAATAVEIASRVARSEIAAGLKTPSMAFADLVMGFEGVSRQDL